LPPNSVNSPSFAEFSILNIQFSITLESAVQLDLNQLCELLTVLDKTGISELTLKSGDLELTVRKGILASSPGTAAALPPAVATVAPIALGAVASPTLASTPAIDQNLGVEVADRAPVAPAAPSSLPELRLWCLYLFPLENGFGLILVKTSTLVESRNDGGKGSF